VLYLADKVREIVCEHNVVEFVYDPHNATQLAAELADEGVNVVQFPQSASRMCPASAGLYAAIVGGRLKHPNGPQPESSCRFGHC
jgi:phage terminase large subunit-like protein